LYVPKGIHENGSIIDHLRKEKYICQ